MKKKGFTLIELLATIVILAAVVVAVTLTVQSIIKSSKISTAKESVRNIFSACYTKLVESNNGSRTFTISQGKVTDSNNNIIDVKSSITGDGNVYIIGDVTWGCVEYPELNGIFYRLYGDSDITYVEKTSEATCDSILDNRIISFIVPSGWAKTKDVTIKYMDLQDSNVIKQYSKDDSTWYTYTGPVNYTDNGTIYARLITEGTVVAENQMVVSEIDNIAPVITLSYTSKTIAQYDEFTLPTYTVSDNTGSTITPVIDNPVDMNTIGTYTIKYTATDNAGNTSTASAVVNVVGQTFSDWATEYPTGKKNIQEETQYCTKIYHAGASTSASASTTLNWQNVGDGWMTYGTSSGTIYSGAYKSAYVTGKWGGHNTESPKANIGFYAYSNGSTIISAGGISNSSQTYTATGSAGAGSSLTWSAYIRGQVGTSNRSDFTFNASVVISDPYYETCSNYISCGSTCPTDTTTVKYQTRTVYRYQTN